MPPGTLLPEINNYITKKTFQIKVIFILSPSDITFRDPLQRQKINGTKNTSDPKARKELFSQDQNNAVKHSITFWVPFCWKIIISQETESTQYNGFCCAVFSKDHGSFVVSASHLVITEQREYTKLHTLYFFSIIHYKFRLHAGGRAVWIPPPSIGMVQTT